MTTTTTPGSPHTLRAKAEKWPPGLTRGNLSSLMTKLEEAGYVEVIKEFIDRKPVTMLSINGKGRATFFEYRKNMTLAIEGSE